MLSNYRVRDSVECRIPHEENPSNYDYRAGLILKELPNNEFAIAKVTKTDRRGKNPGIWIERNSMEGRNMKLKYDSFIQLDRIVVVQQYGIRRLFGACSQVLLETIKEVCTKEGISY